MHIGGMTDAFAHSTSGPCSEWEPLEAHLLNVARLAREFAAAFDSADYGELAGLWHDLGKYRPEFQRLIRGDHIQAPHSGVGAALAFRIAPPVAFAIAGHHTGLANRETQGSSRQIPLDRVISENEAVLSGIQSMIPESILARETPAFPAWLLDGDGDERRIRIEMWTRFLYSALVDADRLATEGFYEPRKRSGVRYDSIADLRLRLDEHADAFTADTPVNRIRRRVLDSCRKAANHDTGLFSLSAPTGAGKTLASMSFALRHAEHHNLRRVIVVVPFTSVIEQNASVYRDVLGERNVIEQHSAIDEEARERAVGEAEVLRRLAIENWDAPVIVTTTVQFFETLFSNTPARCRKLHNVAHSVIVIDEAQTIPTAFLLTMLDGMKQLTRHYGCSLVLSTATQPALTFRNALPQGLENVREIVPESAEYAMALRRVDVRWPHGELPTSCESIASELVQYPQVLAIVHTRKDAGRLAAMLPAEGRFHLSTRMCGAHRLQTFAAIKSALDARAPCRVVSTQLVEAGVDLDFPVVYRAMAGIDSLVQAAGRCNRNGLLHNDAGEPVLGTFVVFKAESAPPPGILRRGLAATVEILGAGGALDLHDPGTTHQYFRKLYLNSPLDQHGVMAERRNLNFANVADLVRLIDDDAHPIVVPYGDAPRRIEIFNRSMRGGGGDSRHAARGLQPFVVQIRERELHLLVQQGAAALLEGFGHMLSPSFLHLYDSHFGLVLDENTAADPEALII